MHPYISMHALYKLAIVTIYKTVLAIRQFTPIIIVALFTQLYL